MNVLRIVASFLIAAITLFSTLVLSAQTKSPSSFNTLAAKADSARDAERLDEAVTLYRKALALRPSWAEGWWSLGTIEYDRNAYAEAAHALRRVVALKPKNGNAHVMLGLSEFELGHDDQALRYLQQGRNLGIVNDIDLMHVVLYHEGILLQRRGRFQAALDTLQQLCLQGVQSDDAANILGMVLLRRRSRTPPEPGTRDAEVVGGIGHAECLAAQKKYGEAKRAFTELVAQYPQYLGIHYAYGLFLVDSSDLEEANAEFRQEIALNPNDIEARLRIAAAMYKVDSAAGLPYAEEAVKLSPQLGFAHYLFGLLLLDTDNYEKALPELEIARKAFPKEAKLYFALGSAYSRAGRKQEAARARLMFERLSKEGARSGAAGEEQGLGGTVQKKIGVDHSTPPPQ